MKTIDDSFELHLGFGLLSEAYWKISEHEI